jgi:mannose/fructose/N-acetylgalactosamine-specific phosphotransferase system component IID
MTENLEEIDVAIEQFRLSAVRYGMEKQNKTSLGYDCDPAPFMKEMYEKQADLKELIESKLLEINC